jgi:phosphate transport system protein
MARFHEELDALRGRVGDMGTLAESMVRGAARALIDRDADAARAVLASEPELDRAQIAIDREAIRLITIYSPVAKDLRALLMIARIDTELERIGDQAVNICEYAALGTTPVQDPQIRDIAEASIAMLHDALEAFRREDTRRAEAAMGRDDTVDELQTRIVRTWLTRTAMAPDVNGTGARTILAARALERVADHATNICEEVFYVVEGADIRHQT